MGILMLAILTMMGYEHIHRMNALTSIFATAVNGVALSRSSWPESSGGRRHC